MKRWYTIGMMVLLAGLLTQSVAVLILRYRSTKGDAEYKPHPLWKTLLLIAAIVIGGTAVCFLLLIMVLSV